MTSPDSNSEPLVPVQRVFRQFLAAFLAVNMLIAIGVAYLTRETSASVAMIGPQLARLDAASQYLDRLQQIRIALATARLNADLAARQNFDAVLELPFDELQHFARRLASLDPEKGEAFLRHVSELKHVARASLSAGWRLLESRELLFPSISETGRQATTLADQISRLGSTALQGWPERLIEAVETAGQASSQGAMTGEPDKLEIAKIKLTAFGTLLEQAEAAVRQAGFHTAAIFGDADRPRSRLYRVIMQYHASALRHRETEASFIAIQNEALALARIQRSAAHEAVSAARKDAANDALLVNIALVLGFCWIMAVLIVAGEWLKRELIRPVDRLAQFMREVGTGNVWAEHRVHTQVDIMKSMVESVEVFRNAMRRQEAHETLLGQGPMPETLRRGDAHMEPAALILRH